MSRIITKAVTSLSINSSARLHRSSIAPKKSLEHEFYETLSLDISKHFNRRGLLDPKTKRVVVTGVGTISPLGNDTKEVFDKAMAGESAIRSLPAVEFEIDDDEPNACYQKFGIHYCADVPLHWRQDCDDLCGGADRAKSEAVKFAEFASIKALLDVGNYFRLEPEETTYLKLVELYHAFHCSDSHACY